jgi:hypothetical protein
MAWTITVEMAFATQPMATTPTWTDITQYVLVKDGIVHTWGRTDEFGDVQPSTISVTLNNRDGRFTRFLSSSPYYPNVRNGKRIRVSATRSAVTYRRFDGHVNEWPTEWVSGRATYAEARITATDRFKRFGALGELRSMLEEEILRDDAIAYYPLGDPSGSTTAGNISTQIQPAAVVRQEGSGGEINFATGTGPGTDELSAPSFEPVDADNGKYLEASPLGTNVGGNPGYTLECFFDGIAIGSRMLAGITNASGVHAILQLDSTGKLQAEQTIPFLPDEVTTSAVEVDDGATHHGALTVSISGTTATMRLYLDGVEVGTAQTWSVPGGALSTYSRLLVGGNSTGDCFRGTLSHVAAHSTALSAARLLDHYNAGRHGLAGERTDQRIGRIGDWVGIPSADRALDVGDSTVSAQATSGRQPLEVMREVEKAEAGVLYISGDNKLTLHNRSRRYNTTPAVTLTGQQIFGDLQFPGDDFGLTNDMTVTRSNDNEVRAVDQTSIDEFGLYRDTLQIPAVDDSAALAAAQWRVGNYGTPRTRVPNVTVDLHKLESTAPSQVALLLAADISTKLRLSSLPSQAPTSTVDVFIEGGTETITPKFWRITFNTSPGDFSQVWQLGVSGFSELGDTTRLGL